ncbi:MAG: tetratricopeptide repeat protein [Solirubrobacteraceae bacterium]|nr:tetratricopeptide repeat protein [Solirubrobacteraceae bacterium]
MRLALLTTTVTFALAFGIFTLARPSGDGPAVTPAAAAQGGLDAVPAATTPQRIARLQSALRAGDPTPVLYAGLASAYLQRVRETGDSSFYARADDALRQGLALGPGEPALLASRGVLRLARHDFRGALADGRAAHRAAPDAIKPLGVLVDALVELGRYDEAAQTLQQMVDRKPNADSYARISYLRELTGDLEGAREALDFAASAGGEAAENAAYVRTLIGNLELQRGRTAAARQAYRQALARVPGSLPARVGLARVDAATGRLGAAARTLRDVVGRRPLPEYAVALGEVELAAGMPQRARRDLAIVGAENRILGAAGVNTDVELALFEADHGDRSRGIALARAAWANAPSVRSADALGWALTRAGRADEGLRWARRALRLGSRDPMFLYHAGIAAKTADRPVLARRWLRAALAGRPHFSPLYAPRAQRALEEL